MSSDYISRLRSELLRAGAAKQARWRPARVARRLRPLAAVAAVALVAVAVVLVFSDGRGEETPVERSAGALRLTYRMEGPGAATAEQAAQVMRARLSAVGIDDAVVSVSSGGSLTIIAPAGAQEDVTALVQRGRLAIYDWERSVLGAPAAGDAGPPAGPPAAISKAEGEARAAGRPDGRAVRDPAGIDRWFALAGDPAMTEADIESAGSGVDPMSQEPIVTIEFTARGRTAFTTLTRTLARRGRARSADGVSGLDANQHFAIVLDDQIVAVPFIDFRDAPNGIDGESGAQIQGGLTAQTARRIAAILSTGPLPAELVLESAGAAAP